LPKAMLRQRIESYIAVHIHACPGTGSGRQSILSS
jgi:hypothetical protein